MDESTEMKDKVIAAFENAFGKSGEVSCYFAPGRVNLIGEHTDYNGGHVFPCALTLGTYLAVRKRDDSTVRLGSVNFPDAGIEEYDLADIQPGKDSGWTQYVKGVIWAVDQYIAGKPADDAADADTGSGRRIDSGLDIMVGGNLPEGAGLSSSASLEVAVGYMLSDQFDLGLSGKEIALLGQRAENKYVGVNCGIMDQFASAMGCEDHAIYLDTATLEYEYVPLSLGSRVLVITNTNKPHSLNDSAYNDRRRECQEALSILKDEASSQNDELAVEIESLCGISPELFAQLEHGIKDLVLLRRARHAVTEDKRVKDAVEVLRNGDLEAFGKLMNESHKSLKDDYEVSCPELDLLAETAREIPGVLGSRMTGGGFGGCTVSIIDQDTVENYEQIVSTKYRDTFGYDCTFIVAAAGSGPAKIIK